MPTVTLPANGWRPRPHQMKLWRYLESGGKRAIQMAHRRWGKDDLALHWTCIALHQRVGTYWHCLPQYQGARKAIWEAVNPHTGKRRIDEAFPIELRSVTRENEMFIKFRCGSTWQVVGSDNYKDLVGTPPVGIVYSEWAKAHPGAWAYLAPVLVENKGWALAITTPEGRNHAHSMFENAKSDPTWHAELQTIEDSVRMSLEAGIEPSVSLAEVEVQRQEYRALFGPDAGDALIQQEWWCSFEAAILGAYFGKQLETAERESRICDLEPIPGYPINTAWDIGVDDPMAIWVFQAGPGWLHILDYIEGSNEGFDYYCNWLNERGYNGGIDWVPHDAKQREPGAPGARTRIQSLIALKRNPRLVPDHKPMDRINAGRKVIALAHFDQTRCKQGLNVLRAYKQEWDQKNRVFLKTAKHDWASHGSDAWGHLSIAVEVPKPIEEKPESKLGPNDITVDQLIKSTQVRDRKWA